MYTFLTWQTGIWDIYQDACQVKDLLVSLAFTLVGMLYSFDHGAEGGERQGWFVTKTVFNR